METMRDFIKKTGICLHNHYIQKIYIQYTRSIYSYYLYLAKSSTDDWSMWSISQDYSAAYTWSNLVCNWRPADIFEDCDGRWPSDDSAQFDYCPVDTTPQSSPTPQPTTPTPQPTTPTPQPTLPPVDTPTEPPSPTPQPTDAPIPTPQPTDPPVDSPAGDCITISGFTQSGWTQQNGIWYEGSTHNGYPSYSKDGWYLYMNPYTFSDGSTYYFWVFSQTLGLNTFNYGYCRRVDGPVTQCGGWYISLSFITHQIIYIFSQTLKLFQL